MHKIYFDGSCLDNGNPGARAGWGMVVKDNKDETVFQTQGPVPGKQTNNRGEIMGMYMSLEWLAKNKDIKACIYGDSEYVVNCINGHSMRRANKDLWSRVEEVIEKAEDQVVSVEHIYRDKNKEADKLAKVGANALI